MGLRGKVVFGLVLFVVIFGLRFLCVNCQQVVADIIVEDHIQPQNQYFFIKCIEMEIPFRFFNRNHSSQILIEYSTRTITIHFPNYTQSTGFWAWHHQLDSTNIPMSSELTVSPSQTPKQTWHENQQQNSRNHRRPGGRKRRRRPQNIYQPAESNEYSYWEGQVQDETLNDTVQLSFHNNSSDYYYSSTIGPSDELNEEEQKPQFEPPKPRIQRVREPLAALEQEQKLSELRDRQRKRMTTQSTSSGENVYRDKSYRKPYMPGRRQENETSRAPVRSSSELKDILKNSGGLSLSEILQQKNLSLDDLIKGKQNALLALQAPAPTTNVPIKYPNPIRRTPTSYLPSTATTTTTTSTSTTEVFAVQSEERYSSQFTTDKILSTPETHFEIPSENLITNSDSLTSASTKNYILSSQTPTNIAAINHIFSITPTQHTTQTAQHKIDSIEDNTHPPIDAVPTRIAYRKRFTIKPVHKSSNNAARGPSRDSSSSSESSSNENHRDHSYHDKNSSSQESIEERLAQKEPETNLIEKFATFEEAKPKDVATIEELFRPLYQKKDNSNLFEAITSRVDILTEKHFNKAKTDVTERNPSLFTYMDASQESDDRTDLLELLEDRRSGSRLFKILEQRNMTLDELIEHRQRGSSQLHLSKFKQNKTSISPTKAFSINPQVLDEKLDIVTAFDNFPHFNLANVKSIKPDEIKTDSEGSSYFTSIIDMKPTEDVRKDTRRMKSLNFDSPDPTVFVASGEDKSIDFYAQPWKSFAVPISYSSQESSNYFDQSAVEASAQVSQQQTLPQQNFAFKADKFDAVAQIEDEVARAHDILDLELSGHGLRRAPVIQGSEISMGVRSAVTASSLIVIFSLAIFLVIFVICRWKQKRRKKLIYMENYNNVMKQARLSVLSTTAAAKTKSTMKRIDPLRPSQVAGSASAAPLATVSSTVSGKGPMIFPGATRTNHKINTMDPNSPEVQDYLFDAMRKPPF